MPAKWFICPSGNRVEIQECLTSCSEVQRCMFLPTLRAIAKSCNRKIEGFSVTELLKGTRELFLEKTQPFAVKPSDRLFALQGTAMHSINENHTEGDILSEERLYGKHCSGQFDLYGSILDDGTAVLGDIKVCGSYKLMKSLGMYKVDVPTGEVYKTGPRQGQPKTVKVWRYDGIRHILPWAIQVNWYRMLLEAQGLAVDKMYIQALCRDYGLKIAAERGIDKPVYLIPVHRLSDDWVHKYLAYKLQALNKALATGKLPPPCRPTERWHGRKCSGYCSVADYCERGQSGLKGTEAAA